MFSVDMLAQASTLAKRQASRSDAKDTVAQTMLNPLAGPIDRSIWMQNFFTSFHPTTPMELLARASEFCITESGQ